ncbi:16S rRNA (uracil(1498)-N(3))-methyltransferase [Candidatus Nomurabacteria bacterium]|nr:16S rRNA (uracil(1498)-N(3))-methyltransferase [Candidatus Nomurabacteria bacterium]
MKTHRLFIDQKIEENQEITLTNPQVIHQVRDVLRLKKGDSLILLDGSNKEFLAKVKIIMKSKLVFEVDVAGRRGRSTWQVDRPSVKLFISMIKKDKIEWVLQKCTEIGVDEFHPIISERTEKAKINVERAEKIIKEASEQSERTTLAKLFEIETLENVLQGCETPIYVLHMSGELVDLSQLKSKKEISILVGPEGGWGEKDLKLFEKYNVKIISLGDQVLRAETASVAVSSLVLLG